MRRGVNKVIFMGTLVADPELRYTGSGTAVCNMRVVTNDEYRDGDGELKQTAEFHNLVAWTRLGEVMADHLSKGDNVYVEGSLHHRSYETEDGNKRYFSEVKVREFNFVPSGNGGGSTEQESQPQAAAANAPDDDLPF